MSNILVLGAFGLDDNHLDGQTVKTRNVFQLLREKYDGGLRCFDTMHVRRNPLSLFNLLSNLIWCDRLVIIPCLNNLTYAFPLTYFLSKIFHYRIIHICVGGWQVEYFIGNERFKNHPLQLTLSKKISAFLPEMVMVVQELREKLHFMNTEMFPNFRFIDCDAVPILTSSSMLRLVFLARVDKKKGYDTIFNFAQLVKDQGYDISIDFYGPINQTDSEDFLSKVKIYNDVVSYKGVLQQDEITHTLNNYDVMLLPTTIYTEGFPGTILDAYIAGIPVIATEWKHSHEFIDDKETGFITPFIDCQESFNESILKLYNDRALLTAMKKQSFEKRLEYSSERAWQVLSKYV